MRQETNLRGKWLVAMRTSGRWTVTVLACSTALAAPILAQNDKMTPIATPPQPEAMEIGTGPLPGVSNAESWHSQYGSMFARNVSIATLTPFLPDPAKASGAAVVVAPGGGFLTLSMENEGWDVARALAKQGVAAFVLKYRLNQTPAEMTEFEQSMRNMFSGAARPPRPDPAQAIAGLAPQIADARAAFALIRKRSAEWHVDPQRIGMVGFSAGAMLTIATTLAGEDAKPAFIGNIYGPLAAVTVPVDGPPLFVALAADDPLFGNSGFGLIDSWRAAKRPVEFHLYEQGGHGFGMYPKETTSTGWFDAFVRWMGMHGMLKAARGDDRAARAQSSIGDATRAPVVHTRSGDISGTEAKLPGVRAYLGIPYAAPPVGDLRWRAPEPAASWKGTRAADRFSPSCIHGPNTPFGPWSSEFLLLGPTSEDCLYLNVWTAAQTNVRQPVLVYIYGGGFGSGSGDVPVYDGSHMAAEQGVVVVNMNYRVGALGFLAHPELTKEAGASGNYGLMDQVAALEWVKDNIAAFGGDPRRVMIAGQSAGAMSVFLHTASPMSKGLFHRAAIESGPGGLAAFGVATARSVTRPRADAEQEGVAYAMKLGAKSLAELRVLPAEKFIGGGRFGPVVDGHFLVEETTETFAAGRQNDVPTLTGLNADEGSAGPGYGKATASEFRKQAEQRYGDRAARFLATYPAGTDNEAHAAAIERARDAGVAGLERLLVERSKTSHTPAFAYYFDRAIPWPEHPEFGAFHTAEVPYVFGTLEAIRRPWTEVDRTLSRIMMSYWANFARTGEPNGAGVPRWAAFDPASPSLMRLGERVEPKKQLSRERYELLTK